MQDDNRGWRFGGGIAAVVVSVAAAGCARTDCTVTSHPVVGQPSDADLGLRPREGFALEAGEACAPDATRIRIRGAGQLGFCAATEDCAGETRTAFMNRVDRDLRAAGTSGRGVTSRVCGQDAPVIVSSYLSLTDWRLALAAARPAGSRAGGRAAPALRELPRRQRLPGPGLRLRRAIAARRKAVPGGSPIRPPVHCRLHLCTAGDSLPGIPLRRRRAADGTTLARGSNMRADKVDSGNDQADRRCWLDRFHSGEWQILEELYYQHFDTIDREVGRVLSGADRETLVYELFRRLLQEEPFRRGFRAGDLRDWLRATARDLAAEYARRGNRAAPVGADDAALTDEARRLMERFLSEVLPPSWHALFQMRFVARLSRTEAAAALGQRRTTLALRELRIRQLLRKFLLAA